MTFFLMFRTTDLCSLIVGFISRSLFPMQSFHGELNDELLQNAGRFGPGWYCPWLFIQIHRAGCFGLGRLVISANFQSNFGVLAKALSRSPVPDS